MGSAPRFVNLFVDRRPRMAARLSTILIASAMLLASSVQAQSGSDVSISTEARPSEVATDEVVTYSIQVQGAPRSAIETPDAPQTNNLALESAPPTVDAELSFDGGGLTRRVTIEWRFKPVQVGIGRIQPVTLRVRDEEYTTEEIRVRIVPQSQRTGHASRPSRDLASPSDPAGGSSASPLGPRDLFIRATSSADTAYQNEQVTVEYSLYFRPGIRLRQSRMAEAWDAPGFWREELDVASRPTPRSTDLYGQTYRSIVLKRVALFPTRTGSLLVDPLRIETEARPQPQMGRRDAIPRSRYEPVTLSSEELRIVARSLPPEPPPAFDGAVGEYALETDVSADSVSVGEAVEVTARIHGSGNIATVSPPLFDPPSDFDVYDPSVQTDVDRSGSVIRGTKRFRYTLVPRSNGGYTLPPVTFSYFSPESATYETLRSGPMTLHVTGDVPPRATSRTGHGLPVGDIAGPMEAERWVRVDRPSLYAQPWAYAVMLVPAVLAAGVLAYRRFDWGSGESPSEPNALEAAQPHLQVAHQRLRDGDERGFYEAVEQSVLAFFDARITDFRPASGQMRDTLDRCLAEHDVSDPTRTALRELLDSCDEAQFSPTEPSYDAMEATLDHAQTLLRRLDETLPSSFHAERG